MLKARLEKRAMMNSGREIVSFKRQAERSYASMRETNGQIALYCYEDANFYMARAIEIACVSGRDGLAARLRRQRDQVVNAYSEVGPPDREPNSASIDRWENEGGALRA
jgi:hypothetical protein